MKRFVSIGFLVSLALCVVACVTQVWKVRYAVEGSNYSEARAMAIGTDGRITIVGNAGQRERDVGKGVFVASFDEGGSVLWEHLLPVEAQEQDTGLVDNPAMDKANIWIEYLLPFGANRLLGTLAMDENNNTYLAREHENIAQVSIYKFDDKGVLQHTWVAHTGDSSLVDELRVGPDQNLYLSVGWGKAIYAFSLDGDMLWTHASLRRSDSILEGSFTFLPNGNIVHVAADVLTLVSPEGSIVSQRTAQSVGVSEFSNVVVVNGKLLGVGLARSPRAQLLEFDPELAVVKSYELGRGADYASVSAAGADVCIALTDVLHEGWLGEPTSVEQAVVHYNALSEVMDSAVLDLGWLSPRAVTANKACYVGGTVYGRSQVRSRIVRFDLAGLSGEAFVIQNTYLGDFRVIGKDIIQIGFTGQYDGPFTESFLRRNRWR